MPSLSLKITFLDLSYSLYKEMVQKIYKNWEKFKEAQTLINERYYNKRETYYDVFQFLLKKIRLE